MAGRLRFEQLDVLGGFSIALGMLMVEDMARILGTRSCQGNVPLKGVHVHAWGAEVLTQDEPLAPATLCQCVVVVRSSPIVFVLALRGEGVTASPSLHWFRQHT